MPSCPRCDSRGHKPSSHTPQGLHRYRCNECGCRYTLMTFDVPLEMTEEICNISYPTAMLWKEKMFSTVDEYQEHLYLEDRVWLDETYLYDSSLLYDDSYKKRGLSKNQLCIIVAIDCHKNTYAVINGHGKPSASHIFEALKNHIVSGSTLVHDAKEHMTKNI